MDGAQLICRLIQPDIGVGWVMVNDANLSGSAGCAQRGGHTPRAVAEGRAGGPLFIAVLPVAQQQIAVTGKIPQSGKYIIG